MPAKNPRKVNALLSTAAKFMQGGMFSQARATCREILQAAPDNPDAHYLMGLLATRSANFTEAAGHFTESLRLRPVNPAGHNNLGVILKKSGRLPEAIASFRQAIAQKGDYVEAHHNLGNALHDAGEPLQALSSFEMALALRPDFPESQNSRGKVLLDLARPAEALASLERAIALRSDYADANVNRAMALAGLRRFDAALESLDVALRLEPENANTHSDRGGVLVELMRYEEAILAFRKAIALDPGLLEARENCAEAYQAARQYAAAVEQYAELRKIDPHYPFVTGNLLHAKMLCCDWDGIDALKAQVHTDLASGLPAAEPFGYQGIADSEEDLHNCARIYAAREFPPRPPAARKPAQDDARIVVGYVCGEFREHATTILMCGVFENHDRSRFRLLAFDNGWDDRSDYRQRLAAAFDSIIDISRVGDTEAAALIASHGVDILVNLNGYYGRHRNAVFSRRPGAIQVNYLGFPGTLGMPSMDYLIADRVVVPAESRVHYTEKIVELPRCYQANDDKRHVPDPAASRLDYGLPDTGFVFCSFNNNYKITPATFESWLRILQRVPGSVLWLLEDNAEAAANLRRAAQSRGVPSERLVFGARLPVGEHLARHRLADLFLDTLPYNAHTTASDALWSGLPVLTCTGTTFPGRVGTSLLLSLGLQELVTSSTQEYEDRAVALATQPEQLAAVRARLIGGRADAPLFDTKAFTRDLERAYEEMWKRHRAGEPPAHISKMIGDR